MSEEIEAAEDKLFRYFRDKFNIIILPPHVSFIAEMALRIEAERTTKAKEEAK